jgi:hypothetical protein
MVGLVWLSALGIWLAVNQLGVPPQTTTTWIFYLVLGFSLLGYLTEQVAGGIVVVALIFLSVCWIVRRLEGWPLFRGLQLWLAWFVAISPLGTFLVAWIITPESEVVPPVTPVVNDFADSRDVVVVVFDAHGSYSGLREFFPSDSPNQERRMAAIGAQVHSEMKANYTLTHLSLASFFEMNYPLGEDAKVGPAEWSDLMGTIRGSNGLVEAFKGQGYRFVLVESGWAGFHCSPAVDECIGGPWPDEPTMLALHRTLLRPLVVNSSEATARGAINTLEWLANDLSAFVGNDQPELIVVHLMLPHPPLRINEVCELEMTPSLGGRTVSSPELSREELRERMAAYVEATECVGATLSDLIQDVGDRAVVVALGDHGPDSQAQLHLIPDAWGPNHVRERLGVLFVTNATCQLKGVNSLVNVGRWLLGCMSHEEVKYLEDRYFVAVGTDKASRADPLPIRDVTGMAVNSQDSQERVPEADG